MCVGSNVWIQNNKGQFHPLLRWQWRGKLEQQKLFLFEFIVDEGGGTFLSLWLASTRADESIDTREGADLVLKCRFTEHYDSKDFTFYWARWTCCPIQFENVAIGDVQLNSNYRLDFRPSRGIYDLQIKNTSYNRDNGRFECRIKAKGTGADVHQEFYNLTVLTPPHPPIISPGNIAVATEDKSLELTCSSIGGSPDPMITWYREGSTVPLQSYILKGGSKNHYTNATLQILPRRVDDGAKYKCVVWNRAMTEGHTLETTVALNVNYYPRVEVGPQNPLRVERDHVAKLDCRVDAKPMVSNVRWTRNGQYVSTTPTHTIYRVSRHHAGKYTCTADNGLGKTGEKDLILDVLYPPIVVIETKTHEAEEGETVVVRCNVTANPPPVTIEWLKEGAPDFRFTGEQLTLVSVRAEHAGNYICRAVNQMQPYGTKRVEGVGNSTVALLVRHRPGQAYITPNKPVVHVGNGVTLSCSASPPGWPVPQYRWFRDIEGEFSNTQKILAQGPQYSIPKAHLGSEGRYHCHAVNELGIGQMATITLEVHQPPQFIAKLQQHMTRRVGDVDYAVTCSAKAKPVPIIRWIKDGTEILAGRKMFDIRTTPTETSNGVVTVQSILKFRGKGRPNGNQLVPSDRGLYTCLYENEVNSANSSMHLRIEHEPIVLHQYNKVAYDVRESAEVQCKVQAYPKPEFQWQFGNNPSPLTMSSDGHYEISTRVDNNDIYTSILRINHLSHSDYGDYSCRAVNPLDTIRTQIRLQPKGPPERPTSLKVLETSHNFVVISWIPGFNGGMMSTKFLVTYRRVPTPKEQLLSDCTVAHTYISPSGMGSPEWLEFDCFRDNPCKVFPLDQHQSYVFKIYALNAKGSSGYSNEVQATTKVSKIPPPLHVTYDPNSHVVGINIAATCLSLIAIVESLVNRESPMATWEIVDTVALLPSGNEATFRETTINHIAQRAHYTISGHRTSVGHAEDMTLALAENKQASPAVRVKLCLHSNHDHCGEYANAEIGKSYLPEKSAMTTSAIVAIVIASVAFLLFTAFTIMLCRCRRSTTATKKSTNTTAKEYDLDSGRPSIVAQTSGQQQQPPPPPYYPTGSLDSKTLDSHAMELTLTAVHDPDDQMHHQQQQQQQQQNTSAASSLYGTQNGYGYHMTSAIGVEGDSYQVIPSSGLHTLTGGPEWSSLHYPSSENNYTNSSNICASIGSNQDTLWRMKMSATAASSMQQQQHSSAQIYIERPPSAFSSCGSASGAGGMGSDPLTQYVVDYVGYPVPPPPHITSVTASGSQHSFQSGSSHNVPSLNAASSSVTSATTTSNATAGGADTSNSCSTLQRREKKQHRDSPNHPPIVAQRYGTLKKSSKHHSQYAASGAPAHTSVDHLHQQQLADVIPETTAN
ncbi:friend of echinoid [Haematobia irritans]|uniref:friend of echinoid n=1 Tax=Haematobia irritans TaxID=7368 RepID=UPI003F4F9036